MNLNPIYHLRKKNYKINAFILSKVGNNRSDKLRYDSKEKGWFLFNDGNIIDITYLDISPAEDILTIDGKKYLLLVEKNLGKFLKFSMDIDAGTLKSMSVNIKIWEARKIRQNNEDYQKDVKWYENPVVWSIAGMIAVVLFSFWFVGNYKEGGAIVQAFIDIKDTLVRIFNGLVNSGIIEDLPTQPGIT